MSKKHLVAIAAVTALVIGGVGVSVAVAANDHSASQGSHSNGGSNFSYYESMMGSFDTNSMMGGTGGSMMGASGYRWMMGGTNAPGWMHGGSLPGYMMGSSKNPGKVMGGLFAKAPGQRVSSDEASQLGNEAPAGAAVDAQTKQITFSGPTAHLVVLASPSSGPDDTFQIGGLVNPTISVKTGAQVSIEVVNADPDTAHGFAVVNTGSASSRMPMVTSTPAFSGSALWFLGSPTSAGMHERTISFTASRAGTYQYLCAVPGHAQKGMLGSFKVVS